MLVAVAGCRGAAADPAAAPAAQIAVPASWSELPKVATSARAAMAPGARARAWGDPAAGCYLVIVSARGAAEDIAEARASLAAGLGFPSGASDGDLAKAGLHGKARGWTEPSGDDVVTTAAACVWSDREPAGCAAACDGVWAKLQAAPVFP